MTHITHNDIAKFADDRVNLSSGHASKFREKTVALSKTLDDHIKSNPDYHLKRIMLSGSLAKRTALRTISDADMALYVKSDGTHKDMKEFIDWLAKELVKFYTIDKREIMKREYLISTDKIKIKKKEYSISITFGDEGLDVDIVPIYWLNNDWDGDLVSQFNGKYLRTNIPHHLEFMNKRHKANPTGFRQVVRLLKYWVNEQKKKNEYFRFKSFMVELIVAHLADNGRLTLSNYPEALREFFDYLQIKSLNEVISFNDYGQGGVVKQSKPINIFDPVNAKNNVAEQYTQKEKDLILDAAMDAAEAIEYANLATTKDEALRQWRKVFGPSFSV